MTCETCQPERGWWHKVFQQCRTCGGWPLPLDPKMAEARTGGEYYDAGKAEERRRVIEALDQLEPHSPTWVQMIRDYILKLEGRKK